MSSNYTSHPHPPDNFLSLRVQISNNISCTFRAVAIGGCDTPLKTSCWQMKGFVGKRKIIDHKTLSYIRFTVGQYWLIKKEIWYKVCQFCEKSCYFAYLGKFVLYCIKQGGGRSSKIIFSGKHFLSAKFTLTLPPLFKPPHYGPVYI